MQDNLDDLLAQLAAQPASRRLNGLEARVRQSIARTGAAPGASWRFASVGLALVVGLWMGGASVALRQSPASTADLSGGIGFAPSSLLDASM